MRKYEKRMQVRKFLDKRIELPNTLKAEKLELDAMDDEVP
jgi:hypothetical protein